MKGAFHGLMLRGLSVALAGAMFAGARFPYAGVNFYPEGDWRKTLVLVREAGFARLRIIISWEAIERSAGKYNYEILDEVVKEARPLGLDITGVLLLENPAYREPNRPSARIQFVSSVAARYRGLIDTYELGDNPDTVVTVAGVSPSSAQVARGYALQFLSLAPVIRFQDPNARVLIGSFNPHNTVFFDVLQQTGALQLSDGVSLNLSFTRDEMDSSEAWQRLHLRLGAILSALGRKQILTAGRVLFSGERSANERAAWAARMAVTLPALDFEAFYLAPLSDIRDDLLVGLLGPTGVPRPAYSMLRNLFSVIGDWRPRPAPFQFSIVFPQMTAGKSGSVYYGNGVDGGIVYWNPGFPAEGYLSLSPRSFFVHQIIDPIGIPQSQISADPTPEGWILKNIPPSDYPRIIVIRSTDYAFLYPSEEPEPIVIKFP